MAQTRPEIIIVMGVAGAGKSTVAARLADALGWAFLDGDALHPAANVDKMRRGLPLTDADRAPWLGVLRTRIEAYLASGERAVIACSALKRAYRRRLRVDPAVVFVYLKGTVPVLRERLAQRRDHFMKATLLSSQLAALEEPQDALVLDARLPVERLVGCIAEAFGFVPR